MKEIKVELIISVPEESTDKDIKDWVDVELCGWNSMKQDNPCIGEAEVIQRTWTNF